MTREQQIAKIRADVEAAKIIAVNNFERDWGTRDVRIVMSALRKTIPNSTSLIDAARKARTLI